METIWREIVKERLRRNCASSLTLYSQKVDRNSPPDQSLVAIPLVHRYRKTTDPESTNKQTAISKQTNQQQQQQPLSMILIENHRLSKCTHDENNMEVETVEGEEEEVVEEGDCKENVKEGGGGGEQQKFQWPGMLEIMEAYKRYSKERRREIMELRDRYARIGEEIARQQCEVKFLERKQRELHVALFRTERERDRLRGDCERIEGCVDALLLLR